MLYVVHTNIDSGGLFYPKAIKQLLAGLYLMEAGLFSLFTLVRDSQDKAMCVGQAVVMGVVGILTVIYHYLLHRAFDPLLSFLPTSLEISTRKNRDFGPFENKALSSNAPVVRLPKDKLGISKDEINQTKLVCKTLDINDGEATIDLNGRIECTT